MTPFLFAVLLAVAALPAQTGRPNLTGKWVLDVAKSDFGQYPPPESITQVIDHKEPKLRIVTTSRQKDQAADLTNEQNLTTDGRENTNRLKMMGTEQDVKSVGRWDGDKLTMKMTFQIQGAPIEFNDTWTLSDGGKLLTLVRVAKTPEGDFTLKTVYNKQ
jgi:hypothetical protein